MTDAQTTFARATLEYDEEHERALLDAITQAIFETSRVSDANAIVLRTGEATQALLTALACARAAAIDDTLTRGNPQDRRRVRQAPAQTGCERRAEPGPEGCCSPKFLEDRHGWQRMSAPQTANRATQLRRTSRKVDRVKRVLAAMANGQSLHLQHRDGRPLWSLSDGRPVPADVAALITRHAFVEPADTALFSDLPGQEWRHR